MSKYERLTVKIIKEHFWDPVTKKGKPITFFCEQDFNGREFDTNDLEFETLTPNGNLVDGSGNIIEDWLSKSEDGPYNGTNNHIFYYLQFNEKFSDTNENVLQIGCSDSVNNSVTVNNYISVDVCDGVDCWIKKEIDAQEPKKFMYCVSSFVLDSNGRSHVKLTVYENYDSALHGYETLKKTLSYDFVYDSTEDTDDYQKIVEIHGSNGQKSITEEGSWKRPHGYELLCIPIKDEKIYSFDIKSWPHIRSYSN